MNAKLQYTHQLLSLLPEQERPDVEQALRLWWMNFTDTGGMRLTTAGFELFAQLEFESYHFAVPAHLPVKPKHLLTLDKKLDCPYYIKIGKQPGIHLFGSKQAVIMAMYGDLEKFLTYLDRT